MIKSLEQKVKLSGIGQFFRFKNLKTGKNVLVNLAWTEHIEEGPENVKLVLVTGEEFIMTKSDYTTILDEKEVLWG